MPKPAPSLQTLAVRTQRTYEAMQAAQERDDALNAEFCRWAVSLEGPQTREWHYRIDCAERDYYAAARDHYAAAFDEKQARMAQDPRYQ